MKKVITWLALWMFLTATLCFAADKIVQVGSTDVTLPVTFINATNGSPYTGLDVNDLDLRFIRVETDNDFTVSSKQDMHALTSLDANHTNDSAREGYNGSYRVDFNDAVFAAGANWARVIIEDANHNYILPVTIDFQLVDYDPYSTITAIPEDVNLKITAAHGSGLYTSEINDMDIKSYVAEKLEDYNSPTKAELDTAQTAIQNDITDANDNITGRLADMKLSTDLLANINDWLYDLWHEQGSGGFE